MQIFGEIFFWAKRIALSGIRTYPNTICICKKTVSKKAFDGGSSAPYKADYRNYQKSSSDTNDYGSWISWCVVAQYNDVLCSNGWRVPTEADFEAYAGSDLSYRFK